MVSSDTNGKNSDSANRAVIERLDRECGVFVRYLVSREPGDYVVRKYRELSLASQTDYSLQPGVDELLTNFASRGPIRTGIADAYARWSQPCGSLRRKLILLVAILENSPRFSTELTAGANNSALGEFMSFLLSGVRAVVSFLIGLLVFLPIHVFTRLFRSGH